VRRLGVGIVVRDTAEDIARGISSLLDDKKLYDEMKENCRKRKWDIDNRVLRDPLIRYIESIRGTR
jgi:glycosyltransferase involved in cell wall biosynthesis